MQNTIIKEFENHPQVFIAAFQQGGQNGETRDWLEIYWSSHYLRSGLIWDESGTIGSQIYGQPNTHLPFGRGFIIDQDFRVSLPYFGHQPQMAIAKIYELLGTSAAPDLSGYEPELLLPDLLPCGPQHGSDLNITFRLPAAGPASLRLYNVSGRIIGTLYDGWKEAGLHTLRWDTPIGLSNSFSSGVYFIVLQSSLGRDTQQIVILR